MKKGEKEKAKETANKGGYSFPSKSVLPEDFISLSHNNARTSSRRVSLSSRVLPWVEIGGSTSTRIVPVLPAKKRKGKRFFSIVEHHWHYRDLALYSNAKSPVLKTIEYNTLIIGYAPFRENTNAQTCLYALHRLCVDLPPTLRTLSIYHYCHTLVEITKQRQFREFFSSLQTQRGFLLQYNISIISIIL